MPPRRERGGPTGAAQRSAAAARVAARGVPATLDSFLEGFVQDASAMPATATTTTTTSDVTTAVATAAHTTTASASWQQQQHTDTSSHSSGSGGEFAMQLKLLTKSSDTTKQKALTSLQALVRSAPLDVLLACTTNLVEAVIRHAAYNNPHVRAGVFALLHTLVQRDVDKVLKRRMVPLLPALSGPWVVAMHDMESSVVRAARAAFDAAFAADKRVAMLTLYADNIVHFCIEQMDGIVNNNSSSATHSTTVAPLRDDALDERASVLYACLRALGYMAKHVSASHAAVLSFVLDTPTLMRLLPASSSSAHVGGTGNNSTNSNAADASATQTKGKKNKGNSKNNNNNNNNNNSNSGSGGCLTAKTPLVRSAVLALLRDVVTVCPRSPRLHHLIAHALDVHVCDDHVTVAVRVWELLLVWCRTHASDAVAHFPPHLLDHVIDVVMQCERVELAEVVLPSLCPLLTLLTRDTRLDVGSSSSSSSSNNSSGAASGGDVALDGAAAMTAAATQQQQQARMQVLNEFCGALLVKLRTVCTRTQHTQQQLLRVVLQTTLSCWQLQCVRRRGVDDVDEVAELYTTALLHVALALSRSSNNNSNSNTVSPSSAQHTVASTAAALLSSYLLKVSLHNARVFTVCLHTLCSAEEAVDALDAYIVEHNDEQQQQQQQEEQQQQDEGEGSSDAQQQPQPQQRQSAAVSTPLDRLALARSAATLRARVLGQLYTTAAHEAVYTRQLPVYTRALHDALHNYVTAYDLASVHELLHAANDTHTPATATTTTATAATHMAVASRFVPPAALRLAIARALADALRHAAARDNDDSDDDKEAAQCAPIVYEALLRIVLSWCDTACEELLQAASRDMLASTAAARHDDGRSSDDDDDNSSNSNDNTQGAHQQQRQRRELARRVARVLREHTLRDRDTLFTALHTACATADYDEVQRCVQLYTTTSPHPTATTTSAAAAAAHASNSNNMSGEVATRAQLTPAQRDALVEAVCASLRDALHRVHAADGDGDNDDDDVTADTAAAAAARVRAGATAQEKSDDDEVAATAAAATVDGDDDDDGDDAVDDDGDDDEAAEEDSKTSDDVDEEEAEAAAANNDGVAVLSLVAHWCALLRRGEPLASLLDMRATTLAQTLLPLLCRLVAAVAPRLYAEQHVSLKALRIILVQQQQQQQQQRAQCVHKRSASASCSSSSSSSMDSDDADEDDVVLRAMDDKSSFLRTSEFALLIQSLQQLLQSYTTNKHINNSSSSSSDDDSSNDDDNAGQRLMAEVCRREAQSMLTRLLYSHGSRDDNNIVVVDDNEEADAQAATSATTTTMLPTAPLPLCMHGVHQLCQLVPLAPRALLCQWACAAHTWQRCCLVPHTHVCDGDDGCFALTQLQLSMTRAVRTAQLLRLLDYALLPSQGDGDTDSTDGDNDGDIGAAASLLYLLLHAAAAREALSTATQHVLYTRLLPHALCRLSSARGDATRNNSAAAAAARALAQRLLQRPQRAYLLSTLAAVLRNVARTHVATHDDDDNNSARASDVDTMRWSHVAFVRCAQAVMSAVTSRIVRLLLTRSAPSSSSMLLLSMARDTDEDDDSNSSDDDAAVLSAFAAHVSAFYARMDELADVLHTNIFAQLPDRVDGSCVLRPRSSSSNSNTTTATAAAAAVTEERLVVDACCVLPQYDNMTLAKMLLVVHRHLSSMPVVAASTTRALIAYAQQQQQQHERTGGSTPLDSLELLAELSCTRILDHDAFGDLTRALVHALTRCYTLQHLPSNGRLATRSSSSSSGTSREEEDDDNMIKVAYLRRVVDAAVLARRGVVLHSRHDAVLRSTVNLVVFDAVAEAVRQLRGTHAAHTAPLIALVARTSSFMQSLVPGDVALLRASSASVQTTMTVLAYAYAWLSATSVARLEATGLDAVAQVLRSVTLLCYLTLVHDDNDHRDGDSGNSSAAANAAPAPMLDDVAARAAATLPLLRRVLVTGRRALTPLRSEYTTAQPVKLSQLRQHNALLSKTQKQKLLLFPYLLAWCVYLTRPTRSNTNNTDSDGAGDSSNNNNNDDGAEGNNNNNSSDDKDDGEYVLVSDSKEWSREVYALLDLLCVLLLTPVVPHTRRLADTLLCASDAVHAERPQQQQQHGDGSDADEHATAAMARMTALTHADDEQPMLQLAHGAAAVLRLLLRQRDGTTLSNVRSWLDTTERKVQALVISFVALHISPALLRESLGDVLRHASSSHNSSSSNNTSAGGGGLIVGDNLHVYVRTAQRCVDLLYEKEDVRLTMRIRFPPAYPLRAATLECARERRSHGVPSDTWRGWVLRMSAMLFRGSASLWQLIQLFRRNLDAHYAGLEPCPICYAVVSALDHKLPTMRCAVCRNSAFHASCLYTWWANGGQTVCPMCRTPWVAE